MTFIFNELKRIESISDPDGKLYRYGYDAAGNLASVTYPDGSVKTYIYNEPENTSQINLPSALTGIYDGPIGTGVRVATYQYDTQGRAIMSAHAGGADKVLLGYNSDGTTTVNEYKDDPNIVSATRTNTFQTVLGVRKTVSPSQPSGAGCQASAASVGYDTNGNIASRTDFNGNRSCFAYDLSRNLVKAPASRDLRRARPAPPMRRLTARPRTRPSVKSPAPGTRIGAWRSSAPIL